MAAGVPRRPEGGVAAIIYNLGRELKELGHEVKYAFLEDIIAEPGVSSRWRELIFSKRLADYIIENREKFSVVNLHAPSGFVYGLRRRWGGRAGYPPYIMTLHGLEERRLHVMSREEKKGRAWNFKLKNRLFHRFYHMPRFRWSILSADAAHTYSRDVWSLLQLKYNLDAHRTAYIANGVEERFFIPREYRDDGRLRLLYAGTWLDQRGIFYLREALRNLKNRNARFTMTFAGCGVPAEEIRAFFGHDLENQVVVRDVVAANSMQVLYAEHDVLLFPSLMEGLPSVLLESMATGMPPITTETCGMPDIVENEWDGLLVPPGDAKAIEEAVLRLAASAQLRRELGERARAKMRRFTWRRSALQLASLFRNVLDSQAA